jgi:hypothetical protein
METVVVRGAVWELRGGSSAGLPGCARLGITNIVPSATISRPSASRVGMDRKDKCLKE